MTKTQNDTLKKRCIFHKTGADTNGEYLEMEVSYAPHSDQPPDHYHPYQEEHFEVLKGKFHTKIGCEERAYETGEKFTVPKNTAHWMQNISDEEGCLIWHVRPAMKTQGFLETMWGLEADGKTNTNGGLNLLQLAVILQEYSDEFRVPSPPFWVQRILFGLLSPIGKMIGYRVSYPQYSSNV